MSDLAAQVEPWSPNAMAPAAYRVRDRVVENRDSVTLCLEPDGRMSDATSGHRDVARDRDHDRRDLRLGFLAARNVVAG